jgi:plasmid replication initiation protein
MDATTSQAAAVAVNKHGKNLVTMSNALTRAGHGLSLSEKRLIASAISKLDSREAFKVGYCPTVKIFASEYAETFGLDDATAYAQLQESATALYNRSITFFEPHFKRNGKPAEPTKVRMRWIGSAKYQKGEGWVEISFWHQLTPHLMGLKKQFTSYHLSKTSGLRSAYSWKLLELLMRFKSTGWAEYSIEDFCLSMEATPKQVANFANIRRCILEPSIKELTEKDGWEMTWHPIKKGRKVTALRFEFKPQQQRDLFSS